MVSRHGLTIASLILGVLGSLYLSYDLLAEGAACCDASSPEAPPPLSAE